MKPVSPPGLAVRVMRAVPTAVAVYVTSISRPAPAAIVALVGVTDPQVTPPVFEQVKLQVPLVVRLFCAQNVTVADDPWSTWTAVPPSGVISSPPIAAGTWAGKLETTDRE
jgi:hypothetical protein